MAMAGSANLTGGGFSRNLEASRLVTGEEIMQLRDVVNVMRPRLTAVPQDQFEGFVSECVAKIDSQEALLDLIRWEIPTPHLGPDPLVSFRDFWGYLASHNSPLARELLRIAKNEDGNNNSGKVKQAFFGIQRFLQEYPQHRDFVGVLPENWFDVADSLLWPDWIRFLGDFAEETVDAYGYKMPTLIRYLTPNSGGTRAGGGGGDNELKRVWPFVAAATRLTP